MLKTRNSDPVTSFEAAESVQNVTETQDYILRVLRRPRADFQLVEAYRSYKRAPRASESGIRSRRAELVDSGLVVDTGTRLIMPSGRRAIVWGLSR